MSRAVMLVVLALLLLAVAGVTAAQEGAFESYQAAGSAAETTAPERTVPEPAAPETTALEETGLADEEAGEQSRPPGQPPARTEKPGQVGKGSGEHGRGEIPESAETDGARGREKVTVCHKGKKTLTVGAPAEAAHLAHGDTRGRCA